jgi:hypothetical protein
VIFSEDALEYGIFTYGQARECGHRDREIRRRIRRGTWVPGGRGRLEVAGRAEQRGDDLLRAVIAFGPKAIASHASAAQVLGWELLEHEATHHVTVPRNHRCRSMSGVRLHRRNTLETEQAATGVLPMTCPAVTALDLAATLERAAAVVALDSALRSGNVTRTDLLLELSRREYWPSHRRCAAAVDLSDGNSASPPESLARLLFSDAGLPIVPQFDVWDGDQWLARVDFALPRSRTAVEIDGFDHHATREQLAADHRRQNGLLLAGWTVLRYTGSEVKTDPERLLAEVRASHRRGGGG